MVTGSCLTNLEEQDGATGLSLKPLVQGGHHNNMGQKTVELLYNRDCFRSLFYLKA